MASFMRALKCGIGYNTSNILKDGLVGYFINQFNKRATS